MQTGSPGEEVLAHQLVLQYAEDQRFESRLVLKTPWAVGGEEMRMHGVIIALWLFISVAWFAINAYLIRPYNFNFWFVVSLPFWIGFLYLVGARLARSSWARTSQSHTTLNGGARIGRR